MAKGDRFWTLERKRDAVNKAEAEGKIADSIDVRAELIRRMERGEITLQEMQAELAKIKRNAKRSGKVTRQQAWERG